MAQTFLSPAQVDELVALYREGLTLAELGERFDIHRRTAAAHLVRRSVPLRQRGLPVAHATVAARLYESGLTLLEIGMRFGVSQQAARRAVAAQGAVIRPGGRRPQLSAWCSLCESPPSWWRWRARSRPRVTQAGNLAVRCRVEVHRSITQRLGDSDRFNPAAESVEAADGQRWHLASRTSQEAESVRTSRGQARPKT